MKLIRKSAAVAMTLVAALGVAGCASTDNEGSGSTQTLNIAVYVGERSSDGQLVQMWADAVAEHSDGRVEVVPHYNAVLLPAADSLSGVGDGRAEAAYLGTVYTPNELPLSNVAGIPFITGDQEAQMYTFVELFETNTALQQEYLQHGVRPVFFLPVGSPLVGGTSPISSIDDLQGKKVRAVGSMSTALQAIGISPMAVPFNELFEALDRNVVDAYTGVLFDTQVDAHLYEVAPHVSDAGMGNFSIQAVVVQAALWDQMSSEDQDALRKAGEDVMAEVMDNRTTVAMAACETLKEGGGAATVWPEREQKRWKEAIGDRIKDEWMTSAGPEAQSFFDEYLSVLRSQEEKSSGAISELALCAE